MSKGSSAGNGQVSMTGGSASAEVGATGGGGDAGIIRPAAATDAASLAAIYRPYVTDTVTSFEQDPPDADEFVRRMLASPRLPWLVAEVGDQVVGYAYAAPHRSRAAYRWSVDCSVYLVAGCQRAGWGSRLYTSLFAELRELGYATVFAGITQPNQASVALHERLGFQPVGTYRRVGFKYGGWHDVSWWQLPLVTEPAALPADPRPWQPPVVDRNGPLPRQ